MLVCSPLNSSWQFCRLPADAVPADAARTAERIARHLWTEVELPHSPFVADLDGRSHWFGLCAYRRRLQVTDAPARVAAGGRLAVHFGAAMHSARVWVDDRLVGAHVGGFLPFEVEVTAALADGQPHTLLVVLDNRDDPDVPPGKPFAELDFCWYGGLYRDAELRLYPPVHITDPLAAGIPAGGGLLVRTLAAGPERAMVAVRVHVRNGGPAAVACAVDVILRHRGRQVAGRRSAALVLGAGEATHVELEVELRAPALWDVNHPHLHDVEVAVLGPGRGEVLDRRSERCGVRRIGFSRSKGLELNGRRCRARGTNRHQEYPYAGYAVPPAAQARDARRIKAAGFDYVRAAHYPPAPEFLAACDELGVLVMNAIPGWQFVGGEAFRAACAQHARDLIRRDRNRACVVLWELSLNETEMDEAFMAGLHAIGHEELPGDQMFTCGWIDRYDVFIHSRQHGELHRWRNADKALVVAEYGDWEFFASNHGFDQKTGAGIFDEWSHGRHLRGAGERGLRQQAWNHVLALNDTMSSPAALDGVWSMFDYARGYDPHRAACGLADIFRLPKFSYHFYRSQRDPREAGAVVFIASHWLPGSDLRVLVFSNAPEVELRLNDNLVARQQPAFTWCTQFLPHAPFVFHLPAFVPGTLSAAACVDGEVVATHAVSTPGAPVVLGAWLDDQGIAAPAGQPDLLIAHAELRDAAGAACVDRTAPVRFCLLAEDGATLLGPCSVEAEAGVASTVVRIASSATHFTLQAEAPGGLVPAVIAWRRSVASPAASDETHAAGAPVGALASGRVS